MLVVSIETWPSQAQMVLISTPARRRWVILHTDDGDFAGDETTPRSLCEVDAESVALICCESLGLEGADYARGYVQHWLSRGSVSNAEAIPEKSAQKIFCAADQIIRAGRSEVHSVTN